MSDANTLIERALNICRVHSTVKAAAPELFVVGLEQLVGLLRELVADEVYVGIELESLTSAALVATGTLTGHGMTTGDTVIISGAEEDEYNGEFDLTGDAENTFTYALEEAEDTPATGTIRALCIPDETGDQVNEDRAATTDLQYALAMRLAPICSVELKPSAAARAKAALPNLRRRFQVVTVERNVPSRLLPRGQGSRRGPRSSAFFTGEALDDDSTS